VKATPIEAVAATGAQLPAPRRRQARRRIAGVIVQ
jgi:hypothetical protein